MKSENELNNILENAKKLAQKEKEKTFLYILPDPENEFEKVFEIKDPEHYQTQQNWMSIMADAYAEYYRNSDFYDELEEDIGPLELILDAIARHHIPLLSYWTPSKTEKINLYWLNRQI